MSLKELLECIFCSNRIFSEYCVEHSIYIYMCVCVLNITAIWHPHVVKSRNGKPVFTPCQITDTSPVSHAALSFGAQATSIQSQCSIQTFNRQQEGGGFIITNECWTATKDLSYLTQPCEDQSDSILGDIQQV